MMMMTKKSRRRKNDLIERGRAQYILLVINLLFGRLF